MSANQPGADPSGDIAEHVRLRLRSLRLARTMSQTDVAAAAGMDTSMVSRLESGARQLRLAHIAPLARALGVTADALLSPSAGDPRVATAPPTSRDGKEFWPLAGDPTEGMHVYRVVLPADLREPTLNTHPGHQFVYVLSGRVRLVLEDRDYVLSPGEAAQFDTWAPHWLGVVEEQAEVLAIFGEDSAALRVRV